jgi:hypothetical protein
VPWIYENFEILHYWRPEGVVIPPTLFRDDTDPEVAFKKTAEEFGATALMLVGKVARAINVDMIKRRLEMLIQQIEKSLDQLKEIEDFFQPAVLETVCDCANQHDNPNKRRYQPGLMSITCKKDRVSWEIRIPNSYKLPSRAPIAAIRAALKGI